MKRSWVFAILQALFASAFVSLVLLAQAPSPWIEKLKSPDAATRARAARELGKSGDASAVPALSGALMDPSEKVRREVVMALASVRQPETLDPLIQATQDAEGDVRVLAVQALAGYYTGQSPSAGFTGFMKKGWQRAKGHFVIDTTRIDPGVKVEPKVITALERALGDARSPQAAREAAKGLGILVAQPAVAELVKAAHSTDEDLAREALNALSKIKERSAGPLLTDLLDSPSKEIKQDAAVTLGILRARDALPKLQAMFENNPDKKTREKALEGLAYLGDSVSVPLFIQALWSEDKSTRTSAAEGLARAADPKTLAELEKAVHAEKDAGVKLAVLFAITALGKDDYLSAMVDELGSTLRGDVARAYFVELSRDSKFLPKLYPYLNSRDAAVRRRLCTVLMFTGDATSLEPLERASHDPNGDVAAEALRALRAVRLRGPTS